MKFTGVENKKKKKKTIPWTGTKNKIKGPWDRKKNSLKIKNN